MSGNSFDGRTVHRIASRLEAALEALLEAFDCAEDVGSEQWEFAVAIRDLRRLGLNDTDLRWLVRKQFVEHAREVTVHGINGREFRPTGDLTFSKRTCFVLTAAGVATARSLHDGQPSSSAQVQCSGVTYLSATEPRLPLWDPERRKAAPGRQDRQAVQMARGKPGNDSELLPGVGLAGADR